MNAPLTRDEFARRVEEIAGTPPATFAPSAYYDPDGDCVEFVAKPDPFYAERVDDLVTVYISQETGEVIGSLIKGVARFCDVMLKKLPGFRIEIEHGRVKLANVFRAKMWMSDKADDDLPAITYRKLIDVAEESDAEAELCMA